MFRNHRLLAHFRRPHQTEIAPSLRQTKGCIMNNRELNELLKQAAPPQRSEQYWSAFPKRVTARLAWKAYQADADATVRTPGLSLGWSFALLAVCVAGAFLAGFSEETRKTTSPTPQ